MTTDLVFYFQVHQPYRIRRFREEDVGKGFDWFDDDENRRIMERVAERCYLPMNALINELIEEHQGRFRCAYSISGTALAQMRAWSPETIESFQGLAETGCVEFLCETSQHSLAALGGLDEFREQVALQKATVEELFGQTPTTFRNTELVLSNEIARTVEDLGFDVILGEGADRLLGGRSPHHAYRVGDCRRLVTLLRDYEFSDDIAFRFSNREWDQFPLYADTFVEWLTRMPKTMEFVGLFMDYETFGEHQWEETGIFEFMRHVPRFVLEQERFGFATPAEVGRRMAPVEVLDIPEPLSWADAERDVSAWLGNLMQRTAHRALYDLLPAIRDAASPEMTGAWRRLSTSDHVYYMCTKFRSDGDVHEYFSPCENPHDAFTRFMFVLDDMKQRLQRGVPPQATGTAGSREQKPKSRKKRRR